MQSRSRPSAKATPNDAEVEVFSETEAEHLVESGSVDSLDTSADERSNKKKLKSKANSCMRS